MYESTFVCKIRTFNIDEIDTWKSNWSSLSNWPKHNRGPRTLGCTTIAAPLSHINSPHILSALTTRGIFKKAIKFADFPCSDQLLVCKLL